MAGVIELRNVCKTYGEHVAVRDVSLQIREGEFFALLGPSGCGKSTTLGLAAGFVEPTSGEILIAGQVVNDTPPHLRNVNTVFQSYALFPHMNVMENVAFGLKMKRVGRHAATSKVKEMLELVALADLADRMPSQLSGGQQQRVALARALVNLPAVLLLDEPLAALDLKLRKQMQLELTTIQKKFGITFVFVTHDQEEAMSMADRIAVMNRNGEVAQVGAPREIYQRPANRFVADFIGTANFFDGTLRQVQGHTAVVQCDSGLKLHASVDQPLAEGTSIHAAVRPESIHVCRKRADTNENWLSGEVANVSFLGDHVRYVLRWNELEVIVTQPISSTHNAEETYSAGETAWLHWSPDHTRVLAE